MNMLLNCVCFKDVWFVFNPWAVEGKKYCNFSPSLIIFHEEKIRHPTWPEL